MAPDATSKPAATAACHRSPVLRRCVSNRFPSPLPWHLRWCAWGLAGLMPALFYIGPLMLILPPFLYIWSSRAALGLLVADLILLFCPVKEWPWFRGVFQLWYELFEFRHNIASESPQGPVKLTEADLEGTVILGMHPHGVIPLQGFLWPALCDQFMPALYGIGATTDAALRLPLLRQVLSWLSAGSAQRDVLQRGLDAGKNLYILPGGVAEIFTSCPGQHVVVARGRHGLMKLALRTNSKLIPMYVFGGTDTFNHLATSDGFFGRLSRTFRAGFTVFWGQYFTPMPYAAKIAMVLGDPIVATPSGEKVAEPSKEQVDALLEKYIDALVRLFDQYKADAGCPEATLTVM